MDEHRAALGQDRPSMPATLWYAITLDLAFIGLYWLLAPLFARTGLDTGRVSRWHVVVVGTVFAVVMTMWVRRRQRASRPAA